MSSPTSTLTRDWLLLAVELTQAYCDEQIPDSRKAYFVSITGDLPPSTLHDTTTESSRKNNRVTEEVLKTVNQIQMIIKG